MYVTHQNTMHSNAEVMYRSSLLSCLKRTLSISGITDSSKIIKTDMFGYFINLQFIVLFY